MISMRTSGLRVDVREHARNRRQYRRRLLKRHGYLLIAPPESFVVTKLNTLADGEAARARRWGEALAAEAALAVPTA